MRRGPYFPDTLGQLHTGTHSGSDYQHNTCVSSSQARPQHGEGISVRACPLAAGRGRVQFLKALSTALQGMTAHPRECVQEALIGFDGLTKEIWVNYEESVDVE